MKYVAIFFLLLCNYCYAGYQKLGVCMINADDKPHDFYFNGAHKWSAKVNSGDIYCFNNYNIKKFNINGDSFNFGVEGNSEQFSGKISDGLLPVKDLPFFGRLIYSAYLLLPSSPAVQVVNMAYNSATQCSLTIPPNLCDNPDSLECQNAVKANSPGCYAQAMASGAWSGFIIPSLFEPRYLMSDTLDERNYLIKRIDLFTPDSKSYVTLFQPPIYTPEYDQSLGHMQTKEITKTKEVAEYDWKRTGEYPVLAAGVSYDGNPLVNSTSPILRSSKYFQYFAGQDGQINYTRTYIAGDASTNSVSNRQIYKRLDDFYSGWFVNGGQDSIYVCYNPGNIAGACTKPQRKSLKNMPYGNIGDITLHNSTKTVTRITLRNSADKQKPSPARYVLQPGSSVIVSKKDISSFLGVNGKFDVLFDTKIDSHSSSNIECVWSNPYSSNEAPLAIVFKYAFIYDSNDSFGSTAANMSYGPYACKIISAHEDPIYAKIAEAKKCQGMAQSSKLPKILGYYSNWAVYKNYEPSDMYCDMDEVIYAFAQIGDCSSKDPAQPDVFGAGYATDQNPSKCFAESGKHSGIQDYKLHFTDPWSDLVNSDSGGHYGSIAQTLATGKPVYLSIAGWTLSAPLRKAIDSSHRDAFIKSIIDYMIVAQNDAKEYAGVANRFAGVDVDWEPNGNNWTLPNKNTPSAKLEANDTINYLLFLKGLKAELIKAKSAGILQDDKLKIAVSANPIALKSVENVSQRRYWQELSGYVDSINLMTYDFHGPNFGDDINAGYTNFNSPLRKSDKQPEMFSKDQREYFNTDAAVQTLISAGVPKGKIGFGVAAYGRAYVLDKKYKQEPEISNYYRYDTSYYDNTKGHQFKTINGDVTYSYSQILTGKYWKRDISTNMLSYADTDATFPLSSYVTAGNPNLWQERQSYWIGTYNPSQLPLYIDSDDYTSAYYKMEYAKQHELGNIMIWDMWGDVALRDAKLLKNENLYYKHSVIRGLKDGRGY